MVANSEEQAPSGNYPFDASSLFIRYQSPRVHERAERLVGDRRERLLQVFKLPRGADYRSPLTSLSILRVTCGSRTLAITGFSSSNLNSRSRVPCCIARNHRADIVGRCCGSYSKILIETSGPMNAAISLCNNCCWLKTGGQPRESWHAYCDCRCETWAASVEHIPYCSKCDHYDGTGLVFVTWTSI